MIGPAPTTLVERVLAWTRHRKPECETCTQLRGEIRRLKRENGILADDNGRLARELQQARRAA